VPCAVLVVAKAPVPGQAKTRLTSRFAPEVAAALAAAALLDTLAAGRDAPVAARVVALTGRLDLAVRRSELADALDGWTVVDQRGDTLGERLAAAHRDAAERTGLPVLQIGMDTPQVTPTLLADGVRRLLHRDVDAVLGPARDGGWWALGLTAPDVATALVSVEMSTPTTGRDTRSALESRGCVVEELDELVDVDEPDDVAEVATALPPDSHFRRLVEELTRR
jgi:glycosyltransferase A (GT-A) superfamily protein (DUF2064 family)